MNRLTLIAIAAAGSAALLLGAWGFQHLGGLAPCKMCIWQRWPHGVAVLAGVTALVLAGSAPRLLRPLAALGALAALATAGIGVYHTGVERGWWQGPTGCSGGQVTGISADELLDQIMAAPLVRCDEVAWAFAGLSMASWNAVISLVLALVWVAALRRA